MKIKLLFRFLSFLFPGVEGEDDVTTDDLPTPDSGSDDDLDLPDDDLPDDSPVSSAPRRDDRDERLARLEAEVERRGRLAEEARRNASPAVDSEYQREEERLRNPETTEMERWQIQANRTLRATQQQAQQAMFEAREMQNRARFESKMASDPRRAKYVDRVEEAVQQERAAGRQADREAVYYYLLGKDIAEGKLKPKTKSASAPSVNRGRTPAVRSDVQGRGRPTNERDKLRARLENQTI